MIQAVLNEIRRKKLRDTVFLREIHVVVGPLLAATEYARKHLDLSEDSIIGEEHEDGSSTSLSDGSYIIWLKKFDDTPSDISTLAHEAFHITFSVMSSLGLALSNTSEEAFAYYIDMIVQQSVEFLRKKPK